MFLIDTNVLSELRKTQTSRIDANVERWWSRAPLTDFYMSVITLLELEEGVLLKERRDASQGKALRHWVEDFVVASFKDRMLSVTPPVARACAALHVPNKRPYSDALIAATARVHCLTVVTRNVVDFEGAGVVVVNPWLRGP